MEIVTGPQKSSLSRKAVLPLLLLAAFSGCTTTQNHSTENPIAVTTLVKSTQSWNGSALPEYPDGQPEVTILRISLQPGAKVDWHKHPLINAGVVLSGSLLVETEQGERLELAAGDPIVEVVNQWHHGINTGSEPTELIVFYAGTADMPLSIKRP